MTFQQLGDITRRITNRLAPVVYDVPISGPLAARLDAYAEEQRVKPETVIAEAVRSYIGDAA
jgi:hypothetical protein